MGNRILSLAWQFFKEEKHTSQQRFLTGIQLLLMVFIVTLGQTSNSIQQYLAANLDGLLGADLVLSQHRTLTTEQYQQLENWTSTSAHTQLLSTTITHGENWQRAQLKGVGPGYPLQGQLLASNTLAGEHIAMPTGPARGEIWLDSRLLAGLQIQPGERLFLANLRLMVTKVLQHEPDRLMEGHSVAMRAMVHSDDLSMLDLPQDLVTHRYLFAADKSQISAILDWQKQTLPAAQVYHKQGAHPLALFWQRTENFIGLASIILFFMAAIAIEQLTRVQAHKEQHFCAVCMSLGAEKLDVIMISISKWLMQLCYRLPAVMVISALLHWFLLQWLNQTFSQLSWQWYWGESLKSILAISCVFMVFQLPVWLALWQSRITQLINNNSAAVSIWLTSGCALTVLCGVALAYSDNALLTGMFVLATSISILLILFLSWLALTLGERVSKNLSGLLPFALFMMKQRLVSKTTHILGVGLCAFLLLFTLMLLKDLGATMSVYQRQHDGNLLVSQATAEQMRDVELWAEDRGAELRQNKPYMFAKVTAINGVHLDDFTSTPSESLATLGSSIRLHWSKEVPANNRVVSGSWWKTNEPQENGDSQSWQQVSLEDEVMTDLGLNIGDMLTFQVAEQSVDMVVSASHVYRPGAGSITFWAVMPQAAIAHLQAPHYSMASLELQQEDFGHLTQLWQKHPSLRMMSLKEMTARFDSTLGMVTQVISGFAVLIITLAGLVILASAYGMEAKEKKKNSIIMSFGFSKETCLQLNVMEWSVTASIAAIGAIVGTWLAGVLLYQSQFSLPYHPDFVWLSLTLLVILLVVTLFGLLASKNSLRSSVRQLLAD